MRITFILPTVAMGGGTRVIGIYAQELMRRGHQVCLISLPPKQPTTLEKCKSLLKGKGWPSFVERYPSHLDNLQLDHRILEVWRPVNDGDVPDADIVIATWWETAEWVNRLTDKKGAKVYFVQGHEVFPHLPKRSRETYRLPMHKIVVAQWLREVMGKEYGDRFVDVVPNSVDHSQFYASPRGKQSVATVGFLYASASLKGLELTLSVFEKLSKQMPELRGVCFGSEPVRSPLLLSNNVHFVLNPRQTELRDLYARCDVWITASRTEGFNLPAMEAMACRTPVVSTRVGWPAEAVKSGWNGVLTEVDDLAALAAGVKWVLTRDEEGWRRLSENAYATVSASSWQDAVAAFERALQNACQRAIRNEIAGKVSN